MIEKIEGKKEIENILLNDIGKLFIVNKYGFLYVTSTKKVSNRIQFNIGENRLIASINDVEKLEYVENVNSYFLTLK